MFYLLSFYIAYVVVNIAYNATIPSYILTPPEATLITKGNFYY